MFLKVALSLLVVSLLEDVSIEVCGLTTTNSVTTEPPTTTPDYCFPNMKNIAVREGKLNVSMNVTASPCTARLSVVPTSDQSEVKQITSPDCTVYPPLAYLYYVNRSGLIIQNSTTTENGQPITTAGVYIADCINDGNRKGAKLLVVRSGPECSCLPDSSSPNVQLSCSVVFADAIFNPIPAIITWIINGAVYTTDAPYRNKTDPYDIVYTASSTITVDGSVVNSYQCILTFGEPTEVAYDWIATNAPEFNESCSTPLATTTQPPTAEPSTITSALPKTTPTSTASTSSTSTLTPPPLPTTTTGLRACTPADILDIMNGPILRPRCYDPWSRCTTLSKGLGILWNPCRSYCTSLGFSNGDCVPSTSVDCPCILPGNEQCRCI